MKRNKILTLSLTALLLISLLAFIGGCYTTTEGTEGEGGFDWTIIVFLVLIIAMFYFLMIHPQRKRQKQMKQMMEELKRGDRIITAGGIYGEIERVDEDSVVIKVESGTTMRVVKSSVAVVREQ